jgi:hypothetical protein
MLDHSCQVQRHPLAERGADLYETPDVAIEALLRVERLPLRVWECACGPGRIVNVLRAHGHEVYASDLIDYGTDPTAHYGRDFLLEQQAPAGCECILTNPPFKIAAKFVAHALKLCPRVIMLMRLAFLEAGELNSKRLDRHLRSLVLDGGWLARVHVFRLRLPMMHRAGWKGRKANSGMSFAWFVWDRTHRGPTVVHRISWERSDPPPMMLGKRGRPKNGDEKRANGTFKRGSNSREYIIARLERDGHIELAAAVRTGRISARAAAHKAREVVR